MFRTVDFRIPGEEFRKVDLDESAFARRGTQADVHILVVRMPHDIGSRRQQHLTGVVLGFEYIIGRLSAYAVFEVGARRDTADFEHRQKAGSDIGLGNARNLDRHVVVRAGERHERRLFVVFPGKFLHRNGNRRIVKRIVARRGPGIQVIRIGKTDRIEAPGRQIRNLRMVGIAQAHHPVIAGSEGRQLRGTGRNLVAGDDEIIHTVVLCVENIHLDPVDLVAEDLGLPVPQVTQHHSVRITTLAHVLPDTRRGHPRKQQAQSENSEFHSLYVFRQ